jgi:cell shape-determining protein MreC
MEGTETKVDIDIQGSSQVKSILGFLLIFVKSVFHVAWKILSVILDKLIFINSINDLNVQAADIETLKQQTADLDKKCNEINLLKSQVADIEILKRKIESLEREAETIDIIKSQLSEHRIKLVLLEKGRRLVQQRSF